MQKFFRTSKNFDLASTLGIDHKAMVSCQLPVLENMHNMR